MGPTRGSGSGQRKIFFFVHYPLAQHMLHKRTNCTNAQTPSVEAGIHCSAAFTKDHLCIFYDHGFMDMLHSMDVDVYVCSCFSGDESTPSGNKATVRGGPGAGDREKVLKTPLGMKSQNL